MIYHNFNPVAFEIFGLKIRWYGIAWSLGFIITYLLIRKYYKFARISKPDKVEEYLIILLLFLLIFTKIFVILHDVLLGVNINLEYLKSLFFSGFSAIGSFVGLIVGIVYLKKIKKENLDYVAFLGLILIGLIISSSFGRIANFLNKEFYGIRSDAPFCVVFFENDDCRLPIQLFESFYYFILSLILLFVLNLKEKSIEVSRNLKRKSDFIDKKWLVLDIAIYGYGIGRFFLEFFKEMPKIWWNFNITQIEIFFILIVYTIFRYVSKNLKEGENFEILSKKKRKSQ